MRTLAEDTDPKVEQVLVEMMRRASPARKFAMIASATRASRQLTLCGLRMRFPNESPERIRRRLASIWLGDDLAEKAYGPLSADESAGN